MDAKERAKQIHSNIWEAFNNKSDPDRQVLEMVTTIIAEGVKQARNEALEESAKLADDCAGHYSPECECMNIAKAIRALKEK